MAKILRIAAAAVPMAAVTWLVSESATMLPMTGLALNVVRVPAAIILAAAAFYFACRALRVSELDESMNAIGGRFSRILRRR